MAINFDNLPDKRPDFSVPNGFYRSRITDAEMRVGKTSGNPYLSVTHSISNAQGKSCGKIFDMLMDSDKDLLRYKLKRFIGALELEFTGAFELKDLVKVIINKELVVDVGTDEKSNPVRNQVEVFKNDIFYPIREWAALSGGAAVEFDAEDEVETDSNSDEY